MKQPLTASYGFWLKNLFFIIIVLLPAACQQTEITVTPPLQPTTPPLAGQLLKGSRPEVYRLMENGQIRHIMSRSTFVGYGYQDNDIITVPDTELAAYPLGLPLGSWITGNSDPHLYHINHHRRRLVDLERLELSGADVLNLYPVPVEFLNQFSPGSLSTKSAAELAPLRQQLKGRSRRRPGIMAICGWPNTRAGWCAAISKLARGRFTNCRTPRLFAALLPAAIPSTSPLKTAASGS